MFFAPLIFRDVFLLRLSGERVYLRLPRMRDWKLWAKVRADSEEFLTPWEPTWARDSLTRAAFKRRRKQLLTEARHGSAYGFLVFRHSDQALMGGITLSNLRRGVSQSGTIGYWIGAHYARQGYMTEALNAVADYAFSKLDLHRLEAACLPENEASRALLQRVGFREEGLARSYLAINGDWRDHVLYGLLCEDERRVKVRKLTSGVSRLAG